MQVRLTKSIATAIGLEKLKPFGINSDSWSWKKDTLISLAKLEPEKVKKLRSLLEAAGVLGVKAAIKDIDTWVDALAGKDGGKARGCRQLEALLIRIIGRVPGHRLCSRMEGEDDVWLTYYVNSIDWNPARVDRGTHYPAYTRIKMVYEQFGGKFVEIKDFEDGDCRGMTVAEALAHAGYYIETPEMRQTYLEQMKKYGEVTSQIGKQYLATGTATDNLDGNKSRSDSWYYRRTNRVNMVSENGPARVVVDVFVENEKEKDRDRETHIDTYFWTRADNKALADAVDSKDSYDRENMDEDDFNDMAEDVDIERPEIEVPVHPFCAVFHLAKHLRCKIHVARLTEYVYDSAIDSKLILPKELKDLVRMLVEHKDAGFKDIVAGKSGGAVVLLTGKPGVGKTLTAEVYAESEKRALYSIQASQLGTDPDDLEDELLKVFTRAKRWNAVMLLDEADVYVRQRGTDLQQNAIVGVFLRVLEYQSSVLFLTTNRPDDVDDAIASRCIARLDYGVPEPVEQAKIWRVLIAGAGISIPDDRLREIVKDNPALTGRDVKNLLKLAQLVSSGEGKPIDMETIRFVRRFKPTGNNLGKRTDLPGWLKEGKSAKT